MKTIVLFLIVSLYLAPARASAGGGHEHHDEHGHEGEEGGVSLPEAVLNERSITLQVAAPASLDRLLRVSGRVTANQNKLAHIHPRFPGILKEVRMDLGDSVEKGETLALIESNQSLQPYPVVSLLSGTVLFRHATVGEHVTESEPIFIVADLSSLWVDLFVFPRDFALIKEGLRVRLRPPHSERWLESSISFVSRIVDERTQARVARATVEGADGSLYPDQYVEAEIALGSVPVTLAVQASAVQRIGERTVVFVRTDEGFEPRDVVLGRSDGLVTEVLSGLSAGVTYAAGNTYLLKAELGKGSAEHEH